jgi:hypothetical protein
MVISKYVFSLKDLNPSEKIKNSIMNIFFYKIYKTTLIIVFITTSSLILHAQEYTKNSIKTEIGVGISEVDDLGVGFLISTGYQREIWGDRFRINPYLSGGRYYGFMTDGLVRYNFRIGTNLYFDMFRIRSFAYVAGVGLLANSSLIPDDNNLNQNKWVYNWGVSLGFRIRKISPKKGYNFEYAPINGTIGNNYFSEMHLFKLVLDIKQKKATSQ